ncbi:MAG: dihydrodipicolinate synthase family protein, partial [Planctomycetes bacterium]|nr:dihydrodipicolinate synthase family protein [Planctomycetota bacterium]
MFEGVTVALVTPFAEDRLDFAKIEELVDWHIDKGTDGILPCGTTGESPTLSHEEHEAVVDTVIKAAGGRVKVLAGAGSNSTSEALRLTRHAAASGADAALVITPYYNKPT